MLVRSPLRTLPFETALEQVEEGAAFVDTRPVRDYLDVHIPGSLSLLYESGPGFASRARDCLPLSLPLVLIESEGVDTIQAAAALRGKGFQVLGCVTDALNAYAQLRGRPASTEVLPSGTVHGVALHVCDPGARPPEGAIVIPIERLWTSTGQLSGHDAITVVAGRGVRAALAVGILERAGKEVAFTFTA